MWPFSCPRTALALCEAVKTASALASSDFAFPPSTASSFPTYLVQAKTEKLLDVFPTAEAALCFHSRYGSILL